MSAATVLPRLAALLVAAAFASGCGPGKSAAPAAESESSHAPPAKEGHDHDHDHDHEAPAHHAGDHEDHDHDHGEAEEAAVASFKAGQGITIVPETQKLLGIAITAVREESLPGQTRFTAQIFGEKHHHLPNLADHSGCDVHGSGLVAEEVAATLKLGDPVRVEPSTGSPLHGVVLSIQKAIALGESEVIVGISNAIAVLHPGDFVPASVTHPNSQPTATIPQSALLRCSEGTFVYRVNGDAYLRTPVRTGAESGGRVALTDGVRPGDQVVVEPVQTLWLIELRATKGGGHSH